MALEGLFQNISLTGPILRKVRARRRATSAIPERWAVLRLNTVSAMPQFRYCWCLLGAALLAGGILAGCADSTSSGSAGGVADTSVAAAGPPSRPAFAIQSVTLDARHPPDPELLGHLRALGVTHLTLVPFGWQEATDDPRVRVDTSDGWYSESHRGIRALARQADTLGMDVILKPHIWIGGYDEEGVNRSNIGFGSEAEWARWENSYRRFLMTYARLARDVGADVLVLGTELSSVSTSRPAYWRALADSVRTVYDGKLTYAANWYEEYEDLQFWDALDYVGVQAYFPLADQSDPSLERLQARWREHRATLQQVHRRTGTPVLFTEIGYRSAATAAEAPWRWPERDDDVPADSALQARCYRAFFSTMGSVPWFAGAILWKWHPADDESRPTAFTPQGKPAEATVRRWFTGSSSVGADGTGR